MAAQVADPAQQAVFLDTGGCAAMAECRSAAEAVTNSGEAAVVVGVPVDLQRTAAQSVLPTLCVRIALHAFYTYCTHGGACTSTRTEVAVDRGLLVSLFADWAVVVRLSRYSMAMTRRCVLPRRWQRRGFPLWILAPYPPTVPR